MFDEMEVDYSADDEVEALKSKVMLDVMEADANTILATNMDAPLQTPGLELASVLEKLAPSQNASKGHGTAQHADHYRNAGRGSKSKVQPPEP